MNDKLPTGILESDLKSPSFDSTRNWKQPYDARSFELWLTTGLGWCIPTLDIGGGRRHRFASTRRTYAVTLKGGLCRIGSGPHVLRTVTVYLRPSTAERLQPFLALRTKGLTDAGVTRDRISSRRAQGVMERAAGRRSWRWEV